MWAWLHSWSCDSDVATKFSFPLPFEVPYDIWLGLAQFVVSEEKNILKSVDH